MHVRQQRITFPPLLIIAAASGSRQQSRTHTHTQSFKRQLMYFVGLTAHRQDSFFLKKRSKLCQAVFPVLLFILVFSLIVGLHVFHPQRDSAVRVPVSYFSLYTAALFAVQHHLP